MLSLLGRPLTDSFTTLSTPGSMFQPPLNGWTLKIGTLLGPLLSGVLVGAMERTNHLPDT